MNDSNCGPNIILGDFIMEYPLSELQKHYTVLKVIGEGGNGRVYSAIDNQSQMMVAIKQIKIAGMRSTRSIEEFKKL